MNEPHNTFSTLVCRGIRGATIARENTRDSILVATRNLLEQIIAANQLAPEDITSAIFTLTRDLNAEYPAVAARQLGWHDVPLMCAQEIEHPQSLPRTIRVLIHWNTTLAQHEIKHIYTNGAEALRPDRFAGSK
ncbi:MAG: chorismate mutase [Anaerolineae bacterium]|nr:chorismate mutase [Anaerolineae bacterium]